MDQSNTATDNHVADLASKIFHLLNHRNYDDPFWTNHFSEDSIIEIDSHKSRGVTAGLELYKALKTGIRPVGAHEAIAEEISVSFLPKTDAKVRKQGYVAENHRMVWIALYLRGNDARSGQVITNWELREGKWKCTKWSSIAGIRHSPCGF